MAGGHLTAVNENGRRKTQRPSSVERDRRFDRRLRNSSFCFITPSATDQIFYSTHSGTEWRFLYQKSCRRVSSAMVACKAKCRSSRSHSISCSATSGSNVPTPDIRGHREYA